MICQLCATLHSTLLGQAHENGLVRWRKLKRRHRQAILLPFATFASWVAAAIAVVRAVVKVLKPITKST